MSEQCFVVGVAGGTGSGKSALVEELCQLIGAEQVAVLPSDAYYRGVGDLNCGDRNEVNYDHPEALEFDLLVSDLTRLRDGHLIQRPIYDFQTHIRLDERLRVEPAPIIIVEGILILVDDRLRELMDLKVFVDAPSDLRLIRRLHRDVARRGRTVESVTTQYVETVRPMHERFVEPFRHYADLEIPGHGDSDEALRLLVRQVRRRRPDVTGWRSVGAASARRSDRTTEGPPTRAGHRKPG